MENESFVMDDYWLWFNTAGVSNDDIEPHKALNNIKQNFALKVLYRNIQILKTNNWLTGSATPTILSLEGKSRAKAA